MKVQGCGEKYYLTFINHFIELYADPNGFNYFFVAVSPPTRVPRFFYNFTTSDSLRDEVFKPLFNAAHSDDYNFLRALTSAGCILLDLVYYPTTQSNLNEVLKVREFKEAVVRNVIDNISNLVRHCCQGEIYLIKLYGTKSKNYQNIEDTMKQIDKELKKRFSDVCVKEIPDFFSRRYEEEHKNKIRRCLEELEIYDELCYRIKDELSKLEKQAKNQNPIFYDTRFSEK